MKKLTITQIETLEYIRIHVRALGYAPSIRDLSQRFEISLNAVVERLHGLEKKGAIHRTNGVARSIVLVDL